MRKLSITSIIMLGWLTVVGGTNVKAQSTHRFVVDIPFQFVVSGENLPAGKYAVQRIDPTKPNLVMLKSVDRGIARLLITQRVEKYDANKTSSLLFRVHREQYYLFQLWMMGENHGSQVASRDEDNTVTQAGPLTCVRLRISKKKA